MGHLSCAGAFRGAAVALAGSSDRLLASIPVESGNGQPATLYLLPARSAGVKFLLGATELAVALQLTDIGYSARNGSRTESGRGYTLLPANFLAASTVKGLLKQQESLHYNQFVWGDDGDCGPRVG
jgi:hypothetical protein